MKHCHGIGDASQNAKKLKSAASAAESRNQLNGQPAQDRMLGGVQGHTAAANAGAAGMPPPGSRMGPARVVPSRCCTACDRIITVRLPNQRCCSATCLSGQNASCRVLSRREPAEQPVGPGEDTLRGVLKWEALALHHKAPVWSRAAWHAIPLQLHAPGIPTSNSIFPPVPF